MKKELFKFGVNNSKLKNTITFSKSSGLTCPAANKCRAMAVMNEDGKRSVKRFKDTLKHSIKPLKSSFLMYSFNKLVLCLVRLYKLGYNASNVAL